VQDLDTEPSQGLDVVLRQIAALRIEQNGAEAFLRWLKDEPRLSNVESRAFGRAVRGFLEAAGKSDFDTMELLGDYLRGDPVGLAEVSQFHLRERLEDDNAFRWLRSLTQTLSILDCPGLVLMFDEMDRNMSLSVGRRRAIGDNLRQMIDHCGQATLPSLLWVYAVPPEFRTSVVPEYPALEQRLRGSARFGPASPLEPVIDLNALPLAPEELFRRIGKRLLELFQVGRGSTLDAEIQEHNLGLLAESMGRDALEVGTRRTFVKQVVHLLHAQALEEKRLERADIDALEVADDGAGVEDEEDIFA
jgi:hypothetical protein